MKNWYDTQQLNLSCKRVKKIWLEAEYCETKLGKF